MAIIQNQVEHNLCPNPDLLHREDAYTRIERGTIIGNLFWIL